MGDPFPPTKSPHVPPHGLALGLGMAYSLDAYRWLNKTRSAIYMPRWHYLVLHHVVCGHGKQNERYKRSIGVCVCLVFLYRCMQPERLWQRTHFPAFKPIPVPNSLRVKPGLPDLPFPISARQKKEKNPNPNQTRLFEPPRPPPRPTETPPCPPSRSHPPLGRSGLVLGSLGAPSAVGAAIPEKYWCDDRYRAV